MFNKRYGVGEIVGYWGDWKACRSCLAPWPKMDKRINKTICCNDYAFQVRAPDVYDVKFKDGKTRAIHAARMGMTTESTERIDGQRLAGGSGYISESHWNLTNQSSGKETREYRK